jgi:phenylacetate-CoA ligase
MEQYKYSLAAYQPIMFDTITFPPEYNSLSLQILETALETVRMYKSWRPLDPGPSYSTDARFAAMPALTKKDIRHYFPYGILPPEMDVDAGLSKGEIEFVQTSGTTDNKITNVWNQTWWDASERSSWNLNSDINKIATGEHKEAILANPRNVGFISNDIDLPIEKRRLSRFLFLNEKTDPTTWSSQLMDRMIEEINVFQPVVLEANPSLLANLCRYISVHNKTVFQPDIIVFTYEYVSVFHYRNISRVFSVPMISSYGTTETGYVFMQCERGMFHQNSDFCRVDFQPLKPEHGGLFTGRLLVTPFHNPWSMMLRFDTGDLASVEQSGKCDCGRNSGLILSSINGRKVNLTMTNEGRLVTLSELDNALSILEGVEEYKLIQVDATTYKLHLVSSRLDKAKLEIDALDILRKLYGNNSNILITYKKAIPPEASGKYVLSRALFPIELGSYLDERFFPPQGIHRSEIT